MDELVITDSTESSGCWQPMDEMAWARHQLVSLDSSIRSIGLVLRSIGTAAMHQLTHSRRPETAPDGGTAPARAGTTSRLEGGPHDYNLTTRTRESGRCRKALIAVDLFSGCGGLSLGLKNAGFSVVAAIELNSRAVKTYAANHQGGVIWEKDIRDVQASELLDRLRLTRGQIDLLAGCPPCQGFSRLRTLNGSRRVRDPRNELIREFQRFVADLEPRSVMMENVPGLANDKRFTEFCRFLASRGYRGKSCVLDAADFGVPQRRLRLVYLAGRGFDIPFASNIDGKKTVRDVIHGLPKAGDSGDDAHDRGEHRSKDVMRMIRRVPKNGGSRGDLPRDLQLKCHERCDGFGDVYGRMAWNAVAPTITSGCFNPSKGRFLHPDEDRAITLREAALLQGFPREYQFDADTGKEALAELIGNAMPPPFVEAHSNCIRRALEADTFRREWRASLLEHSAVEVDNSGQW